METKIKKLKILQSILIFLYVVSFLAGLVCVFVLDGALWMTGVYVMVASVVACSIEYLLLSSLILSLENQLSLSAKIKTLERDLANHNKFAAPLNKNKENVENESTSQECEEEKQVENKEKSHFWRCGNCGKLISKAPCPYCGK
jgi:hypothetical protein